MAGAGDTAIDAVLDAMVDAAPPLDETVRRRLSQLLRQRPVTTTTTRRQHPDG